MTPIEYIRACSFIRSEHPEASKAVKDLLFPFRNLPCRQAWLWHAIPGIRTGITQRYLYTAEFGKPYPGTKPPLHPVTLEISVYTTGVVKTRLIVTPKTPDPEDLTPDSFPEVTEMVIDTEDSADLAGWVSVVLTVIQQHVPSNANCGYFVNVDD